MADKKELTIEEGFEKLDTILEKLEDEDTGLEASFGLYEEGLGVVKACRDKLDMIEKKIIVLEEGNENS